MVNPADPELLVNVATAVDPKNAKHVADRASAGVGRPDPAEE